MSSSSTTTNDRSSLISDALDVWAPDWPRRVTRNQRWANSRSQALLYLLNAEGHSGNAPYISTYSFPRGHTKEGNIPRIDTLFIDFDFEDGDYEPGGGNVGAWRRDLSHLLVRARMVAQYLRENGHTNVRCALSGHKGVHLFIDFPALSAELGTFRQYVNGLNDYATDLVDRLADGTGLDGLHDYVDVTSSDLGRLCRAPNTLHEGATKSFGEDRYCVPVTLDELASVTTDRYIEYTSAPREVLVEREENERAAEYIRQYIATATSSANPTAGRGKSNSDWSRVRAYQNQSNDDITLGDIEFLTTDRPCIWKYYGRSDKFQHGYQSHFMEMYAISELAHNNVPIDVMCGFFDSAPEYDEDYTRQRIKEVIAWNEHRFAPETVLRKAPEFVGYPDCSICQSVIAEHDDLPKITHD